MNLQSATVENSRPSAILSGPPTAPAQENLNEVLQHAQKGVEQSLEYVTQMLNHLGVPQKDEQGQPAQIGVMGRAFDLRSRVSLLNARLEQLAALL